MRSLILVLATCVPVGCGDSPTEYQPKGEVLVLASRDLIATGDSLPLRAVFVDPGGDSTTLAANEVQWSSTDADVMFVSNAGVARGQYGGTARVIASARGLSGFTAIRVLDRVSSFIYYTSEAGDYIGQGETQTHQLAPGSWYENVDPGAAGGAQHVRIFADGGSWWWSIDFAAPEGESLQQRPYPGATRYPFQSPQDPGMDFTGSGRGCNNLTGNFIIHDIATEQDGTLALLHVTFTQWCDGSPAALHGEVRIFSLSPVPFQ